MGNFDVTYLKELVRVLSAGESVPAALRNECHRLMMAIDGNKLALIEECVGRIRLLAQQEGYALPVNSPPLHETAFQREESQTLLHGQADNFDKHPDCPRCRDLRWICEEHPERPWPHDDCPGPGEPCPRCNATNTRRTILAVGSRSRALTTRTDPAVKIDP